MIFIMEGDKVYPSEHALLVSPFKEIWERDKSKKKDKAYKEFTYIEFYCSKKATNPFKEYEEKEKHYEISKNVFREEYEPDELILEAIEQYNKWNEEASVSIRFYLANVNSLNKLTEHLNTLDLTLLNKSGMPVYKMTDVVKVAKEADATLTSLNALKKKVESEIYTNTRTKSNKVISKFEK